MKKSLLIVASFAPSLINFRYELLQELINQDYKVIACAPPDAEVIKKLNEIGVIFIPVTLSRTGANPFTDLLFMWRLFRIMRKIKPDVVLSYTHKPVIYASLAARMSGVSQIYSMITGLGYVFSNSDNKRSFLFSCASMLFKIALRQNKKVFFQNKDNIETFLKMRLVYADKVVLINGSGINLTHFSPSTFPDTCSFLMVTRYLKDKGLREYAAAARLVKSSYPNVSFKLAGWIDDSPNAISQEELNMWIKEGIIEDLGKLADVRPAITEAAVFVLPSYSEGVPHSVLEAMSMARPIITTDAPGCRETVITNINGFMVPVKDIESLAQAMLQFITNFSLCDTMGKQSRRIAEERFDVRKVNEVIIKTMQNTARPEEMHLAPVHPEEGA